MPWGPTEWDHTRHAMVTDVKGYECRMSPTLEYRTELHGHLDDKTTIRITSLDFDFLERVSDWVKEHYPNGELSGGFSRDRIRPAEYVDEGRYRYTLACSQNKKGIAAKRALWAEFFDETFHRKDMDADAEKQKILRDIEQGKAAAHKDAAEMDKETNAMLIYRDPATGWLYRVSPEPKQNSYWIEYLDPSNSVIWKPYPGLIAGNETWEGEAEYLDLNAKSKGWILVDGADEPPPIASVNAAGADEKTATASDCPFYCLRKYSDNSDGHFCELCGSLKRVHRTCLAKYKDDWHDCKVFKSYGGEKQLAWKNNARNADAGSATQSLSAAGPASLEAEPEATPFDYSGLDAQTVADLHLAEREYLGGRKLAEMGLRRMADGVAIAHDALCGGCDNLSQAHNNQYSKDTFGAWCGSIGIHRKAAERLLQVSKLLDNSTPREQKVLEELTPSVLYEASRPSAEPEAVEALKSKQVKTLKEFRALEAQIKAEREAREKAVAEAESLRYANDALRDEAATARAQAKHAQEKADALETRPVMSELFDAKERIKELEARPVEVAVQEPDPAEVERRAGEKAREMTAMLQAQVRGMQEDLDDARKIIDSAESATYMAAAEFAVNAAQVLNGIRASFWAVAKELSDEDFSSAAAPLLEAANRIVDCEWDDDEEEQE